MKSEKETRAELEKARQEDKTENNKFIMEWYDGYYTGLEWVLEE